MTSGSPTLSVPLAKMQEALRVCLQLDPRGKEEKRREANCKSRNEVSAAIEKITCSV